MQPPNSTKPLAMSPFAFVQQSLAAANQRALVPAAEQQHTNNQGPKEEHTGERARGNAGLETMWQDDGEEMDQEMPERLIDHTQATQASQPAQTYHLPGMGIDTMLAMRPATNPDRFQTEQSRNAQAMVSPMIGPAQVLQAAHALGLIPSNEPAPKPLIPSKAEETDSSGLERRQNSIRGIFEKNKHTAPEPPTMLSTADNMFVPRDYGFRSTSETEAPVLRVPEEDGERAPTVCWEGEARKDPFRHVLKCGHSVRLPHMVKCGGNCLQSRTFDGKPKGPLHACVNDVCVRQQKIFLEPPARRLANGKVTKTSKPRGRIGKEVYTPGVSGKGDRVFQIKQEHDATGMLNRLAVDAASRRPARSPVAGPSRPVRAPAPSPAPAPNVTTRASAKTEPQALAELAAGLRAHRAKKVQFVATDSRELRNLHIDANENGIFGSSAGSRRQLKRARQDDDVEMMDKPSGSLPRELRNLATAGTPQFGHANATQQAPKRVRVTNQPGFKNGHAMPHSFGQDDVRNDMAPYFSHPEPEVRRIEEAEGVTFEQELGLDHKGLARLVGRYDTQNFDDNLAAQERQQAESESALPETHCVCHSAADDIMLACNDCGDFFHPGCVGKGVAEKETYQQEERQVYLKHDADDFKTSGKLFTCKTCDKRIKRTGTAMATRVDEAPGPSAQQDAKQSAIWHDLFGEVLPNDDGKTNYLQVWKLDRSKMRSGSGEPSTVKFKVMSNEADIKKAKSRKPVPRDVVVDLKCDFKGCEAAKNDECIRGVFYRYEECSRNPDIEHDCDICEDCFDTYELCHGNSSHRFWICHASKQQRITVADARMVAEEAEEAERRDDAANDASMSFIMGRAMLQKPARGDQEPRVFKKTSAKVRTRAIAGPPQLPKIGKGPRLTRVGADVDMGGVEAPSASAFRRSARLIGDQGPAPTATTAGRDADVMEE